MKKSTFLSNLNALALYGSYKLWLTREDPEFVTPPYLIPHLGLSDGQPAVQGGDGAGQLDQEDGEEDHGGQ